MPSPIVIDGSLKNIMNRRDKINIRKPTEKNSKKSKMKLTTKKEIIQGVLPRANMTSTFR